ncbi:MAG TPA: hypothetical protein VK783_10380 [Bacteroidia bacterium]|jgi:hypothetical protein|nr:hypothetical protein [Bacteroidia bacterium]
MRTLRIIFVTLLAGAAKLTIGQDNSAPAPAPAPVPQYTATEEKPYSGFFNLGFGITQPTGVFGRETGTSYNGYALSGGSFSFSAGLPIAHSNFGVALMYNYSSNLFDVNDYVNNIQMGDASTNYAPVLQDAYDENFFLAGLYATIPVNPFAIDFRLMGGPAVCDLPEVVYSAEATSPTATQNFVWHIAGSTSTSFATDAGITIRYKVGLFSLLGGIDYLWTDPMVSTTERYTDQYGNVTYSHVGGSSPISFLNYSLGFGFQFW